jgi:hypothetical protein
LNATAKDGPVSVSTATAASELLALWERAAAAAPNERDEALLAAVHDTPPTSLGARNAALLSLRARLFGQAQPLLCDCPRCGSIVEFAVDCASLSQALLPADDALAPQRLEAGGHRIEFRVPDVGELRAASSRADDDTSFVEELLRRCVTRCERDDGGPCAASELPESVAAAVSRRMEELEPGASVSFDLTCPDCRECWGASMHVADVLWSELQSRAERLLLDVDALARAYGWSEEQVLALSPMRRAAYLQLVGSG